MKHKQTTVTMTRQGVTAELDDLLRSKTQLECIVDDLRAAEEKTGGKREELEAELTQIQKEIEDKEDALNEVTPKWEQHHAKEIEEKRRCVWLSEGAQ